MNIKRLLIFLTFFFLVLNPSVFAKETSGSDLHTIREEKEGKEIFEKLTKKEITCSKVSSEQFASLGEFFMGRMMGDAHDSMNQMMVMMMGKDKEDQMHTVMGKQMSGCEGGENTMMGFGNYQNMMSGGFGLIGGALWVVILIDLILLGVWLWKKIQEK